MSLYNGSRKIRDYDTTGVYVGAGKTNCITHIPEDIKLELNNGVVTLKAGSKVYFPNGFEVDGVTKKFDAYIVPEDKTMGTVGTVTANGDILYLNHNKTVQPYGMGSTYSSSTTPTSTTYAYWYDTANNVIKITSDKGATWTSGQSLPIAIMNRTSGTVTAITQVFNGFGYIGNTTFALPNVKGLIPNGWDGNHYDNIELKLDKVVIDREPDITRPVKYFLYENEIVSWGSDNNNVMYYDIRPSVAPTTYCTAYIKRENRWIRSTNSTAWVEELNCFEIGDGIHDSSGHISSITFNTVKTTNDTVSVGFIYKGSELVYKGRHYESWSMPSSPSSKGYTLSGNPSDYVDRLFDKSSSTGRWGQGVSNSSKWFGIKFPFPVIIDSITVKQGFSGSHDDSRTYSVRFRAESTGADGSGGKINITNQTNLNWAVDSSTNIPIISKPICRRLYCDCTMQEYGTLNEVYISGRRVL